MKVKKNNINLLLLMLFPLIFYQFYKVVYISQTLAKMLFFVMIALLLALFTFTLLKIKKHSLFQLPLKFFFLVIVFSMFNAYMFWGQDFILSFRSTAPYMGMLYFFLLVWMKPSIKDMEKIFLIYCFLYILLWCYGLYKAPEVIFGADPESSIDDSRGVFRLLLAGKGFLVLALFYYVNQFVLSKKSKWLIVALIIFLVIVLQVMRQMIFFSLVISVCYILKNKKWLLCIFVPLLLIVYFNGVNYNANDDSVLGKLISLSVKQFEQHNTGDENIRVLEYIYFFTSYSKNIFTDLMGNGVPHYESLYGVKEVSIMEQLAYYMSDVGYAELFIRFGIIGMLLYLYVLAKAILYKGTRSVGYAKMFIIYIVGVSIGSNFLFIDAIPISIALYIIELDKFNCIKEKNNFSMAIV